MSQFSLKCSSVERVGAAVLGVRAGQRTHAKPAAPYCYGWQIKCLRHREAPRLL